jgi:hypothetical protein
LDAAVAAGRTRVVTIDESLAHLMLVTPGCQKGDRALARRVLAQVEGGQRGGWRRWLQRQG